MEEDNHKIFPLVRFLIPMNGTPDLRLQNSKCFIDNVTNRLCWDLLFSTYSDSYVLYVCHD